MQVVGNYAARDHAAIAMDLKLQDRLTAVRNVRPGARFARLQDGLAQELLQELLGLPERVNAQQWLAAERGAAVALLTLQKILILAGMMYGCYHRLPPPFSRESAREGLREDAQEADGGLFGALLRAKAGWAAPTQAIHSSADPSARRRLEEALRELRRQSGLPTEAAPARSQVDPAPDTLLADLLRLPDSADPVQWLQDHRPALCAQYILQHVLRGAIPAKHMDDLMGLIYPRMRAGALRDHLFPPEEQADASGRLHASVTQIDRRAHGFVVYVECRYGLLPEQLSKESLEYGGLWEGFRSVRDSAGHHYVVDTVPRLESNNPTWWWKGEVAHACWPALGEARELILESQPAYLTVYRRPREGGTLIPLPGPSLGSAHCTAVLGA